MNFFELSSMYSNAVMVGFLAYGLLFIPVWKLTITWTDNTWKGALALAVAFVITLNPELYHFVQWHLGGSDKQIEMQMLGYGSEIVRNAVKVKFWAEIIGGAVACFLMNRFG
ncbi:hypothetical protein [Burkholderia thailandensis]|uniref:hypothetical protein n=1 Tax=Burkholderia thailandensis TaxID=57975 RepID=UPI000AB72A64|nr:hypothetical protein [Burkholderia thailandensis]